MHEAELYRLVTACCDQLGLDRYHDHDARRNQPGWPDLVIWGPGGIVYRELKSDLGRPSRAQLRLGQALAAAGADWAIWRPDDWRHGTIASALLTLAYTRHRRQPQDVATPPGAHAGGVADGKAEGADPSGG